MIIHSAIYNNSSTSCYRMEVKQSGERFDIGCQSPLAGDIDALVRNAYSSGNEQMWGTLASDYFVRAQKNMEVKLQVKMRAPTTLPNALDVALHLEAI